MAISIIIRATDPSETAAFYRALGVPFEADERHPDGFSALVAAEVVVERAAQGPTEARLRVRSMIPAVTPVLEAGGRAHYARVVETPPVVVVTGPGETVVLEEWIGTASAG